MSERTETQLRAVLLDEAADVSDAQDFAARVDLARTVIHRDRRRRGAAVAAACAVAAAVAVVSAVLGSQGSGHAAPHPSVAPAVSPSSVIGINWVLVDIGGSHGQLDLVAKHLESADPGTSAWVQFDRNGHLRVGDDLNISDNRYRLSGSKLVVRQGATTLAGIGTGHSLRARIVAAMDSLTGAAQQTAAARIANGRLVLTVGGYVLTFRNDGPSHLGAKTPDPTPTKAVERIYPPDVTGETQLAARAAMYQVGLIADQTFVTSRTVPRGSVVSQTPPVGRTVPVGSHVLLRVSNGP